MTINRRSIEYLFVLYMFLFAFVKPVIAMIPQYSTVVLFVCAILIFIKRLMITTSFNKNYFVIWGISSFLFLIALILGEYFNHYDDTSQYIVNFIIYGIIPVFLIEGVEDFSKVLYYIHRFSIIATVILIWDPFVEYAMMGEYMTYGLYMLWYSFAGLLLTYYLYEKKYVFPLIVIDVFVLIVYGNKGAALCGIFLLFLVVLLKRRLNVAKIVLLILATVAIFSWKSIVIFLVTMLSKWGYSSYSLTTLLILVKNTDSIVSTRTNIWKQAFGFFLKNPLGSGVGAFEKVANGYAHNIELDIMVMFGIVGIVVFIVMLVWAIFRIAMMEDKPKRIFLIGCGMCWFIPMQISLTIWNVLLFWIFWGVLLYDQSQKKGTEYENIN